MSDRAGRWVTEQIGRYARSVNEIALELGCDWHTVNDTVIAYGTALVDDDPKRFGVVRALGLDEVLFARVGPFRGQDYSTQMVDVGVGQLLDVVPCRSGAEPTAWLERQGKEWRDKVRYATLDLSSPYRKAFTTCRSRWPIRSRGKLPTPSSTSGAAGANETMGHRGGTTLTIGADAFSPRPKSDWAKREKKSSWVSYVPVTPAATWPPCGKPKKPSASSTPTPTLRWPWSGSSNSGPTSKTPTTQPRHDHSAAR